MPAIALAGQLALKNASVLIVGAGGLGCPAAAYLAGAGIGHIGVVDGDVVEESNLQRQILYGGKVGRNKAESLVEVLRGYVHKCYSLLLEINNVSPISTQYENLRSPKPSD
jgi:adenylyltransferase/sulfurtransferase